MSNINDGGPAFPGQISAGFDVRDGKEWHEGMSLRDYFAASALNQRKALSYGGWYAADAAREAYEIADAMLAARKGGA